MTGAHLYMYIYMYMENIHINIYKLLTRRELIIIYFVVYYIILSQYICNVPTYIFSYVYFKKGTNLPNMMTALPKCFEYSLKSKMLIHFIKRHSRSYLIKKSLLNPIQNHHAASSSLLLWGGDLDYYLPIISFIWQKKMCENFWCKLDDIWRTLTVRSLLNENKSEILNQPLGCSF